MNLSQSIKPVSYLRKNTTQVLDDLEETGNPLIVTVNGEAKAVMIGMKEFDMMNRGVALLKRLAVSSADVQNGRTRDADDVFSDMRTMIEKS